MDLFGIIRRILRSVHYRISTEDWMRMAIIADYKNLSKNKIYLSAIDLTIQRGECAYLLEGYEMAKEIVKVLKGKFYLENGELMLELKSLKLNIQTAEELFIVKEIFLNNVYSIKSTNDKIVFDVGLNVGFASLYFASLLNTKEIVAFEPFKPTFKQAVRNLELNGFLKEKINVLNYGLGKTERTIDVEYSKVHRGRMGIHGINHINGNITETVKEKINIKSANEILLKYLDHNKNFEKVIKIDCEGAEYEIIESLDENNMIGSFDIYIIEWHFDGPAKIESTLLKNNFRLISLYSSQKAGLIYGFKSQT